MIVVLGSGIAGTAAALAARARGEEVTLVRGAPGASALGSGAIDDVPWEEARGECAPVVDRAELDALELYELGPSRALVATSAGRVRPARGLDRALLDLARVPEGPVVIPAFPRENWDAEWLARALAESARRPFEARPAQLLVRTSDRSAPDAEIAARHDNPGELADLVGRLAPIAKGAAAVLLPPWLGIERPRAEELSRLVGVPCGELAAALASPAGLRFARARDRALERAGVRTVLGFAERVDERRVHVGGKLLPMDAVVVAIGGILAGGMRWTPSEATIAAALPRSPQPSFSSGVEGAGVIGARGSPIDIPGSLFGTQPESVAWPFVEAPLLESVGFVETPPFVFAAGDALADQPRTFLVALASGVRAGRAATAVKRPLHP